MNAQEITVIYSWTAKDGQGETLKGIYREVEKYTNKLVVTDVFANAEALGFHLGVTAAAHFRSLLEIAVPGPFLFCGNIPQEMQQAAIGMGLNATFAPYEFGFSRDGSEL